MSSEFKVGDVVKLKSGSPKMTISSIENKICNCVWFEQSSKMEDSFSQELLEKYEPGSFSFKVERG